MIGLLNCLVFERVTISRTKAEFKKHRKTTSSQSNSGRTFKPTDKYRRTLKCIVGRMHSTTAVKVTTELNQHLNRPDYTKTVLREIIEAGHHGRAAIRKTLLSTIKIQKRLKWCRDHKSWSTYQWKQVIFSDGSSFSIFSNAGRVYVWRHPREAHNPDCLLLLLTVKHRGGSVMVWEAITWNSLGPIVALHYRIISEDYLNI